MEEGSSGARDTEMIYLAQLLKSRVGKPLDAVPRPLLVRDE